MTRVTSVLLMTTGLLLLVTWLVSSVSSAPPLRTLPEVPPPPSFPELDDVNREVERLRQRMSASTKGPAPTRDPFQFSATPTRTSRPAPDNVDVPDVMPESLVAWPRLVAILASGSESEPAWQAVFEDANQTVQIRSAGETIDGVVVSTVTSDGVVLTSPASSQSTRLSVR